MSVCRVRGQYSSSATMGVVCSGLISVAWEFRGTLAESELAGGHGISLGYAKKTCGGL